MKEKILETFKDLGFAMEEVEGLGYYSFQYEGKHYLYMQNEDDEDFLNIAIPAVLDIDDENSVGFYRMMDKINETLKYVKANTLCGSMWLSYERELFGGEDMKQVISRMILHLEAGFMLLHQAMEYSDDEGAPEATDGYTDDKEDANS